MKHLIEMSFFTEKELTARLAAQEARVEFHIARVKYVGWDNPVQQNQRGMRLERHFFGRANTMAFCLCSGNAFSRVSWTKMVFVVLLIVTLDTTCSLYKKMPR